MNERGVRPDKLGRSSAAPVHSIGLAALVGAAGDGGHEEDAVALFEGAGFAAEEADVFFVEVDVEELADLAGLVADVFGEVGELGRQLGQRGGDRRSVTVHLWRAVSEAAERGGDFDCYAHPTFSSFVTGARRARRQYKI